MKPIAISQRRPIPWQAVWLAAMLFTIPSLAACGRQSALQSQPAAQPTPAGETLTAGDVPDNALFITYQSKEGGYAIQYVEGWAVKPAPNGGVAITNIDSAELVDVQTLPTGDLQQYVTGVDEAHILAQAKDYHRIGLEMITLNGQQVAKLMYTWTSAPDAVTNKSRVVATDRYYIPGPNNRLAVLSLTTPQGVDNLDAFNQMAGSFTWTPG